ncbi:MAG TPA: hypothetical protein V6D19_13370 [Stenomitos sp.]
MGLTFLIKELSLAAAVGFRYQGLPKVALLPATYCAAGKTGLE